MSKVTSKTFKEWKKLLQIKESPQKNENHDHLTAKEQHRARLSVEDFLLFRDIEENFDYVFE